MVIAGEWKISDDGSIPVAMTITFGILFPRRHTWRFSCPEVMVGINVTKIAPHIIHCTTGNAFDHTLLISGVLPNYWKPEPDDTGVHHHNYPDVHQYSSPTRTTHRLHPTPAYIITIIRMDTSLRVHTYTPPDDIQLTPTSPVTPQVSETRPHFQSA